MDVCKKNGTIKLFTVMTILQTISMFLIKILTALSFSTIHRHTFQSHTNTFQYIFLNFDKTQGIDIQIKIFFVLGHYSSVHWPFKRFIQTPFTSIIHFLPLQYVILCKVTYDCPDTAPSNLL